MPKDVDLNHYFEVMNSRGEQLEKHEIIKARLCEHLNADELTTFSMIWEACSDMNRYIQQKYQNKKLFGNNYEDILEYDVFQEKFESKEDNYHSINDLLNVKKREQPGKKNKEEQDSFQSIIDFPNFLLIVLKLFILLLLLLLMISLSPKNLFWMTKNWLMNLSVFLQHQKTQNYSFKI